MSSGLLVVPPTQGWVLELREADALLSSSRSASSLLRVARASSNLRQWKKCKTAARLALAMKPPPDEAAHRELEEYLKRAEEQLAIKWSESLFEEFRESLFGKQDLGVDDESLHPRQLERLTSRDSRG